MSVCLCLPFANHEWSALSSATKNKKSDEKERLRKNNWRARRQLLVFGPNAILVCGPKAIFISFLSASARRSLHMRRRKGGQTSSRFTRVSDGSFRRTLHALGDAASVLAFPFKIFEVKKAFLYRCEKAKVHTSMATKSKQIPGLVTAKLDFPLLVVSSCFRRLYGGSQATVAFSLNGCREQTAQLRMQ